MSLRAKLEAVIYAAEEPVTLAQLAQIFASDALEWKASQSAAAAESNAEIAGESPEGADTESRLLLEPDMASLGMSDTVAMSVPASEPSSEETAAPESSGETQAPAPESEAASQVPEAETASGPAEEGPTQSDLDPEAEARRLARLREREIKAILKQILDELIAN